MDAISMRIILSQLVLVTFHDSFSAFWFCSIDECGFSRICLPAYIKDSHISLDLLLHDMIYLLVAAATSSSLLAHQKLRVNALTASNHPQIIPVGLFSINKV